MPDPTNTSQRLEALKARWESDKGSRVFLQLADEYRRLGRLEDAAKVLEEGLQASPGHLGARVARGRCLIELGRAQDAVGDLEKVIQADPTQMVAYRLLVQAYISTGDAKKAGDRLRVYSLLNDSDPEIEGLTAQIKALSEGAVVSEGRVAPAAAPSPPEPVAPAPQQPEPEPVELGQEQKPTQQVPPPPQPPPPPQEKPPEPAFESGLPSELPPLRIPSVAHKALMRPEETAPHDVRPFEPTTTPAAAAEESPFPDMGGPEGSGTAATGAPLLDPFPALGLPEDQQRYLASVEPDLLGGGGMPESASAAAAEPEGTAEWAPEAVELVPEPEPEPEPLIAAASEAEAEAAVFEPFALEPPVLGAERGFGEAPRPTDVAGADGPFDLGRPRAPAGAATEADPFGELLVDEAETAEAAPVEAEEVVEATEISAAAELPTHDASIPPEESAAEEKMLPLEGAEVAAFAEPAPVLPASGSAVEPLGPSPELTPESASVREVPPEPAAASLKAPEPARPHGGDGGATVTLGRLYLRQGHLEEAGAIFREILERNPDDPEARRGLEEVAAAGSRGIEGKELLVGFDSASHGEGLTARKRYALARYLALIRGGGRHVH